ncbi:ABC transporter substrate-binding protein [Salininema proteolyticum]|uniref:ABC transporter substrate-binding protein n=1 Tax=Salininema proteolyticum TaxID=1607685 RepID=A0ABV8U2C7_9ACTN
MTSQKFEMSRRRLMQTAGLGAAGVAGAGVLSACKADSPGGGGSGERRGTFTMVADMTPDAQHKNPLNEEDALLVYQAIAPLFYPKISNFNWSTGEYIPMLGEVSMDEDAKLLTIKVKEGIKWTDGNDVTAADVEGALLMDWANSDVNNPTWPYVDGIEVVDEQTVEVSFSTYFDRIEYWAAVRPAHSSVRYADNIAEARELFEQGTDAWGSDAQSEYMANLANLNFEDWISCGPYKFESQNDNTVVFTHNPDGLFADQVMFEKVAARAAGNTDVLNFIQTGEVDYSTNVVSPSDREALLGIDGVEQLEHKALTGAGIALSNTRHPELADYNVRKAILHAMDRDGISQVALGADGFTPNHYDSGYPVLHTEELVSDLDGLTYYDYDLDKATKAMEAAGWEKDGDKWVDPNGETKKYALIAPEGWNDWIDAATAAAKQLQEFGLNVEFQTVPHADIADMWVSGEYDMTMRHWGSPFRPMYSGSGEFAFLIENLGTKSEPGMGVETEKVETEAYGEVNVRDIYEDASSNPDEEKLKEANEKLAVIFNETLPRLPLWEDRHLTQYRTGNNIGKVEIDAGLADNDPTRDNPLVLALLNGKVTPV